MRLLLVEDDEMIATPLLKSLGSEGYLVDWARDGFEADSALENSV